MIKLSTQRSSGGNFQCDNYILWLCIITNIFHEWVKCLDNKVLGYNLLIRSGVQLYLYNDIKYN